MPERVGTILIGGSPNSTYLELAQYYRPKHLYFEGFKGKKELAKYFQAADLFVLPTREDIWGLVINEAMAYGLPIITTNKCIAGLALLKGGYSIIPTNDATTLHNNIVHLINSPEEQKEMSTQNLQTIHQYTIEKMAHTIFQILNQ